MDILTEKFAKLCLNNTNKSVIDCYNYFMESVEENDCDIISDNFDLFIKVGEMARKSGDGVKKLIRKEVCA